MSDHKKNNSALCPKRSFCPLTNALDILGDKWTMIVIRDMLFFEKKQFNDFLSSPEGISTNILTERLKRLEEHKIIKKTPYQKNPVRYEYTLTKKGSDLMPAMINLIEWGLVHIKGTAKPPPELIKKFLNKNRKQ